MECQMRQIATELLPRVPAEARDNAIALQESRSQAFIAIFLQYGAIYGLKRTS